MSTKRGFRSWGAAARRFVVVGMAIGVFHVAPAAADLSFTLDLEGCSIGCDIPGMRPLGTIVYRADPGTNNIALNWQVADVQVQDRELGIILAQLMSTGTVIQDYYSQPYLARGILQQLYQVVPRSTGFSFNPELPLASYAVGFVQPTPSPSVVTANSRALAVASVSEPTSLALLGAGLAGFAFLRRRRYI